MNNQIRVVMVEPGKPAYETCIESSLTGMQKAVDGYIEIIPDEDCVLVCNEEGKIRNLKGNRHVYNDIIAGTFFVAADNDELDICSLTDEQVEHFLKKYAVPENIGDDEVADAITAVVYFEQGGFSDV